MSDAGMSLFIVNYETVETEYGLFIKATEESSKVSVLARTDVIALKLLLIKLSESL